MNKAEHKMERIILNKDLVDQLEEDMLIRRHIERYALVRQYVFGRVLDVACGVGYGSYLLVKNPDVEYILGVDSDKDSIAIAKDNFIVNEKIGFVCNTIEKISGEYDVLVSLETIEHLEEPKILANMAERCNIKEAIISFPMKKTTHYNKYHLWDLESADIKYIFSGFQCINEIINGDSLIMHFIKREEKGYPRKKYFKKIEV